MATTTKAPIRQFEGFPKDGLAFLRELAQHNEKPWFDANKARYQESLVEPGRGLVVEVHQQLMKRVSKAIRAEPAIGGSIFRIHRDTRFSKDKTPYKTHFDMWWWDGDDEKGRHSPGFFLRLVADQIVVGAGIHGFEREQLERYRAQVADEKRGKALVAAVDKVKQAGFELGRVGYKKVPRGFDAAHPRAELLKHEALYAHVERKPPKELHSRAFVELVVELFRQAAPVERWLREAL